jgi:hypothetical protein
MKTTVKCTRVPSFDNKIVIPVVAPKEPKKKVKKSSKKKNTKKGD